MAESVDLSEITEISQRQEAQGRFQFLLLPSVPSGAPGVGGRGRLKLLLAPKLM